jgi:hypothetical protein
MSFTHLPLSIHNTKGDVIIWWPSLEPNDKGVFLPIDSSQSRLEIKLRCLTFVEKLRVKDVEFVPLDNFRRWIFAVIVDLVVFVPFIPLLNAVVIAGFSGNVRALCNDLLKRFFFVHNVSELHLILLQTLFLDFLEQL